jgi:putative membrane protein
MLPFAAACAAGMGMTSLGPTAQADVAAHSFVTAVDAGEIQQAQLAQQRASSAAVRDFATRMISDHSTAIALRESRMQQMGLGLRTSTAIAMGNAAAPGTGEHTNGQGVISNTMAEGGTGTTPAVSNAGGISAGSGSSGSSDAGDHTNGQGVVSNTMAQGGTGTTPAVSNAGGIATGSATMTPGTGAFTASTVLSPMGMDELNTLLLQNPYSRPVAQAAQADLAALSALSGPTFDRAYMDRQVAAHQYALNSLDQTLASASLSSQLRSLLTVQRAAVAQHLQMAQQIRAGL